MTTIHCFSIPALNPEPAQSELNTFLSRERVLALRREFIADGAHSYWAFCVELACGPGPLPDALRVPGSRGSTGAAGRDRGAAVDYKQVLSDADFMRFAALRDLRKQQAQAEGVPVYAVFSNEQLAAIVTQRVNSLAISVADVAARPNLALATFKAARGKHARPGVAAFLADADTRLEALAHSVLNGTAPSGQQRQFVIHDPKRRTITAACFADRVLHHAILNLAGPRFEQALVPSAFACRKGLGVHAAVAAVQRGLQSNPWAVQVDVDGYFPSINHVVLRALLDRLFKGADFLALPGRVIKAGSPVGAVHGVPSICQLDSPSGLPIGALTSQHFANAYLGTTDRLLLAHPGVGGHVRYMDDMVWFCSSRAAAQDSLAALQQQLASALHLRLKAGVVLQPSAAGLHFCGCFVKPGLVLASPRKRSRYRAARRRLLLAKAAGTPQPLLQRAHSGNLAALLPAQSLHWRQRLWWGAAPL